MGEVVHINSVYSWHCGAFVEDLQTLYHSTTNESHVTCPDCLALKQTAEYGTYKPSFPRTKFADENEIWQQTEHVISEAEEADDASTWDYANTAMELLDVIHSAETALFILAEKHGVDLSAIKRQVIEKNQSRGYYDKTVALKNGDTISLDGVKSITAVD